MPECTIVRENQEGRVVFRLAGTFDRASAWKLRERVAEEDAGELVLDFRQVREFYDLGVAVLAHGLLDRLNRKLVLRGLRNHQLRMFRYFGIEVEESGAARRPAAGPGSTASHA